MMIGDFILEKMLYNTLIMMYYIYSEAILIKERKKIK